MLTQELERTASVKDESTISRSSFRGRVAILLVVGLSMCLWSVWHFKQTGQLPFLHRESVWSIAIYEGNSPLELQPTNATNKPVLTAADVTDVDALFVADPFMVRENDQWYMFIEVLNKSSSHGDIGLATSSDGLTWEYERIVLDESVHLSYPRVFKADGKWWMLPQANDGVHLYQADAFPGKWRKAVSILEGDEFADPTMFQHDGLWWMFVARAATHDQLRLFYANEIVGPWTEHAQSPVVESDPEIARPGGPVVRYQEQLYRFAQDCAPKYGNQLRAFRITKLTTEAYQEEPYESDAVLTAGSHAWNASGMHHLDPHKLENGKWRAAVDGHRKSWILQAKP